MLLVKGNALLLLYLFLSLGTFGSKYRAENCDRTRRPYHLLTTDEKQLYVDAIRELKSNGKLDTFTEVHIATDHYGVHKGSNIFFWHSYLIWELETQIRELGDKYECFSLPYWDITYDSGSEDNPFILQSSFLMGGDGIEPDYCVADNEWNTHLYWTQFLCADDNTDLYPNCCVKRCKSDIVLLPSAIEVANIFITKPNFKDMCLEITDIHGTCHIFIGSKFACHMNAGWSPDDPIFWLLHSFIDYLRAIWSSCWNYDMLDLNVINDNSDAYTAYCQLDDCGSAGTLWEETMDFSPWEKYEWSLFSNTELRLKDMYDISEWGIKYELGTFWKDSHLNELCSANINDKWFTESDEALIESIEKSTLQQHIDNEWNIASDKAAVNKMSFVSSSACKFNRKYSSNSCWDESMIDLDVGYCSDDGIESIEGLTLDKLQQFKGVKDNECLQKIRSEIYNSGYWLDRKTGDSKLRLCNGEFDYVCKDYDDTKDILYHSHINNDININNHSINSPLLYVLIFSISLVAIFLLNICCKKTQKFNVDGHGYGTFEM